MGLPSIFPATFSHIHIDLISNRGRFVQWNIYLNKILRSFLSHFLSFVIDLYPFYSVEMDFLRKRQLAWEESFRSLYYMLRKKVCNIFYGKWWIYFCSPIKDPFTFWYLVIKLPINMLLFLRCSSLYFIFCGYVHRCWWLGDKPAVMLCIYFPVNQRLEVFTKRTCKMKLRLLLDP